jgi:hypothetical protein
MLVPFVSFACVHLFSLVVALKARGLYYTIAEKRKQEKSLTAI